MPEPGYIVAVLVIVFVIDLGLRALPFAFLKPLRDSAFVNAMSLWMPAGLLLILAAATLMPLVGVGGGHGNAEAVGTSDVAKALVAVGVTVGVHLFAGRRTLLSVGLGTATYVALVNLL